MTTIIKIDFGLAVMFAVFLLNYVDGGMVAPLYVAMALGLGLRLYMSYISLQSISNYPPFVLGMEVSRALDGDGFILNALKLPWLAHAILWGLTGYCMDLNMLQVAGAIAITTYPIMTSGICVFFYRLEVRRAQARIDEE